MSLLANPHPQGCPWHDYADTFGAPNVKWCEETLCSWISEPANTWSNVGYLIVGLALWALARKQESPHLRLFGPAAFVCGLFSFLYHLGNNFALQVLDFIGMFIYCFVILSYNFTRLGALKTTRSLPFHVGGVLGFTALVLLFRVTGLPFQLLIVTLVLAIIGTEIVITRRGQASDHAPFLAGLGLLLLAGVFSALDVSRTVCDPKSHFFQGHAAWHVIAAASMVPTYRFFTQFKLP